MAWHNEDFRTLFTYLEQMQDLLSAKQTTLDEETLGEYADVLLADTEQALAALRNLADAVEGVK